MPPCKRAAMAHGFTLVELIVAMSVFAILATIAMPAFTTYFEKTRLRAAADAIASLAGDARLAAVKQGRVVSVRFAGAGAHWCIGAREAELPPPGMPLTRTDACDCMTDADDCVVDARRVVVPSARHDGVTIATSWRAFAFDGATGRITDAPGVARLVSRSGRYTLELSISPLGQTTMCSRGGALSGVHAC